VLRLAHDVLPATFAALRACGEGRRECVVYWTGPSEIDDVATAVVHPEHTANGHGYEIAEPWLNGFFLDLRAGRRSIRAQVHTHPHEETRHSSTDDGFAVAPHTGFVSVVLPHYAMGPVGLGGAYVAKLDAKGEWVEVDPSEIRNDG
jgi:hypothetical protein